MNLKQKSCRNIRLSFELLHVYIPFFVCMSSIYHSIVYILCPAFLSHLIYFPSLSLSLSLSLSSNMSTKNYNKHTSFLALQAYLSSSIQNFAEHIHSSSSILLYNLQDFARLERGLTFV